MGLDLSTASFLPHGYCITWQPTLLWIHIISDLLIALAYFSIPMVILYILKRQGRGIPYPWVFGMFATFILCCGITHLIELITLWYPVYYLEGFVKMLTAAASVATAVMLIPVVSSLLNQLKIPSSPGNENHPSAAAMDPGSDQG